MPPTMDDFRQSVRDRIPLRSVTFTHCADFVTDGSCTVLGTYRVPVKRVVLAHCAVVKLRGLRVASFPLPPLRFLTYLPTSMFSSPLERLNWYKTAPEYIIWRNNNTSKIFSRGAQPLSIRYPSLGNGTPQTAPYPSLDRLYQLSLLTSCLRMSMLS